MTTYSSFRIYYLFINIFPFVNLNCKIISDYVSNERELLQTFLLSETTARAEEAARQGTKERLLSLTPPHQEVIPPTENRGNCFFDGIARLWNQQGVTHLTLRQAICQFVEFGGQVC